MNRTLLSTRRLIVSGDMLELYEYERPYSFNLAPLRLSSGDLEDKESSEKTRRVDNLGRVRNDIRRIIEANYRAYGFEPVFLTLTFKENVTDVDQANLHFHDFIKRLDYKFQKRFRYLAIVEFQKRGAVHYHCIFFNMDLEIERSERRDRVIASLWRVGFVDIERVRHAKVVSAYVCKYLNKAVHDSRLRGRKAYFTSRALFRPREFRREASIDKVLRGRILETRSVDTYQSLSRGLVKYYQYVERQNDGVDVFGKERI